MTATQRVDVHRFTAFGGARCEILACGVAPADLAAGVAEVYAFEQRLTRFRADSELSRFNVAAGWPVPVSPLLEELLRTALDAYTRSEGLVNAAVLPALVAAGYDRSIEHVQRRGAAATVVALAAPPVPPLPDVLEVGHGWARLSVGCAVDLGGVGKGWLADRLAERLEDVVVNLGGDLRAAGDGPDGDGWTVGLCDGSIVSVRDAGVATSGIAGRHWTGGHHLVDPRSGRPADTDVLAVSVVAGSAEVAETLAKAAAVLGSRHAPGWLAAHGAARWAVRSDAACSSGSAAPVDVPELLPGVA